MCNKKRRYCRHCKATLVGKKQHWSGMCSSCIRKIKKRFGVVAGTSVIIIYSIIKKIIVNRKGENI